MNIINNFLNNPLLEQGYWGNSLRVYLIALFIFFGFYLFFAIFQRVVLRRLKKLAECTKSDIDDELIKIVRTVKPPFYSFLAFYIALQFLVLNDVLRKIVNIVLIIWFSYQIIAAIQILINYIVGKRFVGDSQSRTAVGIVSMAVKISLWSIALLMILSNLGVNITSLIAGLGIGGIAIAMALKNVLSDLFGSLAIYFDKPFLVGDFIIVGDIKGSVEKIGMKTTRIRAPSGEEVVVPNDKLTSGKIQNFRRLKERRVSFKLGVVYNTPTDKLKKIPDMIKNIVDPVVGARFDRVHFTSFGDSALLFDVIYYIESAEYIDYLNANQEINLKIQEAFEKEKISMAYPTQTIYLEK